MSLGLPELIAPTTEADFLSGIFHQRPLFLPGARDRFAGLFSWEDLNRALGQHRLEFPRLRLVRESAAVPPERYTERVSVGEGRTAPRVLVAPLTDLVRQGATLIVDAVDELSDPLQRVAADLERLLRSQVGACAYFSGTTEPAFAAHIDQVDTFVLQLHGAKRWRIYEPTREAPLLRDVVVRARPPEKVIIDEVMRPGDLLYFPRGWWHSVETTEPPAMHVTLGVAPACGTDLLEWMTEQLLGDTSFRRDIPILGSPEEQAAYMDGLLGTITKIWNPDLLRSFLQYRDLQARARQRFGFPAAATPAILPAGDDVLVRFAAPRASIESAPGAVRLHADGRRWVFDDAVTGLLQDLLSGDALSIGELSGRHDGTLDREDLRILLEDLHAAGLLHWVPSAAG
ncbi:cupin domain-containing protein [Plantactinospora sp. CA-290183]|uniref:cupin domain-containing protein n=1 Tax=Plantactinospora sp. CA-290183 TaxID=3240006 RepID=UPI003D917EC2